MQKRKSGGLRPLTAAPLPAHRSSYMTHSSFKRRPTRRSGIASSRSSITLAFASLLALTLIGTGCGRGPQAKTPEDFAVPVEMAKAETRSIRQVLDFVGSLEAKEAVMLKPEISGKIASIHFKEGDQIEKGALLVQLDDRETAASLREAQADLSFAGAEYARRKNLYEQQIVSKQELERARAEMDRIAAHVELMKARLVKTSIKAPFSGIVGRRRMSPGAVVEPGDDLANFEVINPLTLNFEVPERYLLGVRAGQPVKLNIVAFPDRDFEGTVYFIDPRVSAASRSVTVKAFVPNPELVLRAGMFANTHLLIEEKEEAVTVPEQSLVPQGDQQFVFKVKSDSTVDLVPVQTGIREAGVVEILQGVSGGDTVVVSGHQKIGPGSKVMPFGAPPPGAAPTAEEGGEKKPGDST